MPWSGQLRCLAVSLCRPAGGECERQQVVQAGVAVDGAGLVQVPGDLQLREAVREHPRDGCEFAWRPGAEFAAGLGVVDQFADGVHAVVGGGFELPVGLVDRVLPKRSW